VEEQVGPKVLFSFVEEKEEEKEGEAAEEDWNPNHVLGTRTHSAVREHIL